MWCECNWCLCLMSPQVGTSPLSTLSLWRRCTRSFKQVSRPNSGYCTHARSLHTTHPLTHTPRLTHTHPPSGNTFIDEISEHITQFVQRNLMMELALDPSDESLLVSREKVNGHIYHMFKDGQVTLPEPVTEMG